MRNISIPEVVKDTAECVIKDNPQGEVGDKFRSWDKMCVLTYIKTVQARDAQKLYKDCGFTSSADWKKHWLSRHLFPPNPDDILYAHYFEEAKC